MNTTAITQNVQTTMSSREVAELTGHRHDQVLRTARALVEQGVTQSVETLYTHDQNGQQYPEHRLTKRDSLVLVARLSPEFTALIIDRWQELENGVHRLPQTMAEALRLAADQQDQIEQQQKVIDAARPAVEFTSRVQVSHDAITVAEAAKAIGTGRTRLYAFLRHAGWVNRRNEPYQARIEAGLMDVKISEWEHPGQGLKESITALVTGKGLVKLQRLWEEQKGAAA